MRTRGGIRMRPTGGMRQKLGHEQAGLRDVLVPVRARLGIALLGLKVDVEQAIALVIAVGPGELVLQRPHEVTVDVYAAVDCLEDPCEMLTHVVDARCVVDKAVLGIEWMDCDALHNTIDCPIWAWRVRRVSNAN